MDLHYGITDSKPWKLSRRQVSRQMSFTSADYYSGEVEYATAVAAAAYAISTLESVTRDQKQHPRTHLEKTSSQKEPKIARPYDRGSQSFTDVDARRKGPRTMDRNETLTEKIIRQVPSMKRTPTSIGSKKYSEDIQSSKPEIDKQLPDFPPPPPTQFVKKPSRVDESEADAWERNQLDKIKQRYEKLNMTILEWEDKKRKKAERKLARTEGELGKRRAKALQNYQNDLQRIKQVADGARAQVKEKRRKQELKVKEKANKFRTTGQPPRSCFCF